MRGFREVCSDVPTILSLLSCEAIQKVPTAEPAAVPTDLPLAVCRWRFALDWNLEFGNSEFGKLGFGLAWLGSGKHSWKSNLH